MNGVRHESNRGIAEAWATGTAAATGRFVCFIDADLQHRPEDVITLYDALQASTADVAQGIPRHRRSQPYGPAVLGIARSQCGLERGIQSPLPRTRSPASCWVPRRYSKM